MVSRAGSQAAFRIAEHHSCSVTADLEDCRLAFGPRSLVVVGGVPGAGKTILLDRLGALPGTVVLDSAEPIRRWRRLPLPYRLLRPLVHSEHHVRIAFAVLLAVCDGVVVHEPATRAASRRRLLGRARLTGRPAHLVLLDVDPATARAGQIARGALGDAARSTRDRCGAGRGVDVGRPALARSRRVAAHGVGQAPRRISAFEIAPCRRLSSTRT